MIHLAKLGKKLFLFSAVTLIACTSASEKRFEPVVELVSEGQRDLTQGTTHDVYVAAPWKRSRAGFGDFMTSGGKPGWNMNRSSDITKLEEAAELSLVHALRQRRDVRLFLVPPARGGRSGYLFSTRVTEYSEDISKDATSGAAPTFSVGMLIVSAMPALSAGAMAFAGPIGSFISNFDVLTGIPIGGDSKQTVGVVTIDVSASDVATGRVLLARPVAGQFLAQTSKVGSDLDLVSGSYRYARSLPQDAIDAALQKLIPEMLEKLERQKPGEAE